MRFCVIKLIIGFEMFERVQVKYVGKKNTNIYIFTNKYLVHTVKSTNKFTVVKLLTFQKLQIQKVWNPVN